MQLSGEEASIDAREAEKAARAPGAAGVTVVLAPWLLLCGAQELTVANFSSLGVTVHVNCAAELGGARAPLLPGVLRVDLAVAYRSSDASAQRAVFEKGAAAMVAARDANGRALVNCARGRSRSVAVVLYYLMRHEDMSLRDAYTTLKAARPMIGPSRHLVPQLLAMELALRGATSLASEPKWSMQIRGPSLAPKPKKSKKRLLDFRQAAIDAAWREEFAGDRAWLVVKGKPPEHLVEQLREQASRRRSFVLQYAGEELAYAKSLFK